jgi:hypothetical protein
MRAEGTAPCRQDGITAEERCIGASASLAACLLSVHLLGGCAVVAVGDAVVGVGAAAVSVAATTVKVGAKAVGAVIDAVIPDSGATEKK